jgi:hypothetical protein
LIRHVALPKPQRGISSCQEPKMEIVSSHGSSRSVVADFG